MDLYSTSSRKLLRSALDSNTIKKNSFQMAKTQLPKQCSLMTGV